MPKMTPEQAEVWYKQRIDQATKEALDDARKYLDEPVVEEDEDRFDDELPVRVKE